MATSYECWRKVPEIGVKKKKVEKLTKVLPAGSILCGKTDANVARGDCGLNSVLRPRHLMNSWASSVRFTQVFPEPRTMPGTHK